MYKVPQPVVQAILDYLVKQPYVEVFQLINQLQRLEKLPEPKKPKTP